MEQLNYYDLEKLLSRCVSGEINIHQPIEVTNKLKNQKVEMSFLKHVLVLCQSDKKSLIHILSTLRCRIKNNILELMSTNAFIRHYIENIIREWLSDVSPIDLFKDGLDVCGYSDGDDLFLYQALLDEKHNSQVGGNHLDVLETALKQRQESFTPLTHDYANQIQEKIKGLYNDSNECVGRVKGYSADIMTKQKMINPLYNDILLDLSTKSKSTYLEFSTRFNSDENEIFSTFLQDSQDLQIPDNIHTIFLNYMLTINMLKKELNYINNSFKGILSYMQPKIVLLSTMMEGLNELDSYTLDNSLQDTLLDSDGLQQDLIITHEIPSSEIATDEQSTDNLNMIDRVRSFSFF